VSGPLPRIVRRLPEPLPLGERILWQGAPGKRSLAIHVFHVRKIAIYFGAIVLWRAGASFAGDQSLLSALAAAAWVMPLALGAVAFFCLFAYLVGRTTTYTITDRRIIMQYGVAFPMTLNIPFRAIGGAAVKIFSDGSGDIPVTLTGKDRVAYLVLWPHARAWRFARPEPMLRAVPDVAAVAKLLAGALRAANGEATSTSMASTETQTAAERADEATPAAVAA
jgi:hypothetical protein